LFLAASRLAASRSGWWSPDGGFERGEGSNPVTSTGSSSPPWERGRRGGAIAPPRRGHRFGIGLRASCASRARSRRPRPSSDDRRALRRRLDILCLSRVTGVRGSRRIAAQNAAGLAAKADWLWLFGAPHDRFIGC
jgi:hypothetical protein